MRRISSKPSPKEKLAKKIITTEETDRLAKERKKIALESSAKRIIDLLEKTHTKKMELSEIAKNLGMFETSIVAAIESTNGSRLKIEGGIIKLKPPPEKPRIITLPSKY